MAGLLAGCGTSSEGSKYQAENGVSPNGYPAEEPKDAGSPALASSTESQYSREQPAPADSKIVPPSDEHPPAANR